MKKLITFIIIILSVIPIYGKKINYKSSCVYYYLPLDECLDSRGFLNFEYATLKGPNFWALIFLDNGDVLFENNTWGKFKLWYGV